MGYIDDDGWGFPARSITTIVTIGQMTSFSPPTMQFIACIKKFHTQKKFRTHRSASPKEQIYTINIESVQHKILHTQIQHCMQTSHKHFDYRTYMYITWLHIIEYSNIPPATPLGLKPRNYWAWMGEIRHVKTAVMRSLCYRAIFEGGSFSQNIADFHGQYQISSHAPPSHPCDYKNKRRFCDLFYCL
jgi:hypothetical protein